MAPAVARAQDANSRWAEIQRLTQGRAVKVTVGGDTLVKGTFVKASGNTLVVRRGKTEMTLDRSTVRAIKAFSPKKHRLNMILYGTIGVVAGAIPGAMLDELAYNETGESGGGAIVLGALGGGIALFATRHSGYTTEYSAHDSIVAPLSSVAAFDQLGHRIGSGDKVYVTSSGGAKIAGTVDGLSSTLLAIRAGGKRYELRPDEVKSISQRLPDSLVNGTLWGALVGGGLAVAGTGIQSADRGYNSNGGDYLASAALGGGIGAGVGAVIDALHNGRKVVYTQPSEPKSASRLRSLNIAPVISKNQKGAALSFAF